MMYNVQKKSQRNRVSSVTSRQRYCLVLAFLFASMAFFVPKSDAQANLPPKYSLTGDINLHYERTWMSEGFDTSDQFIHSYHLKLSSYISDPRLIQYDIDGMFNQELNNPARDLTTYGIGFNVTFLNTPTIKGPLGYLPRPINVRYSYQTDSEHNTFTNYGISMMYKKPEKYKLFYKGRLFYQLDERQGQNNINNLSNNVNSNANGNNNQARTQGIPFPVFYFDYDVNKYTIADRDVDTSHLNFRADLVGPTYDYRFQYLRDTWDYGDLSDSSNRFLLDVNYHFFDKETKRRFEIFNRIDYYSQESADDPVISFTNSTIWSKPIGNNNFDTLSIGGGLQFVTAAETSYAANISPVYMKRLSPQITDSVGIAAAYTKTPKEDNYYEYLFNNLYYDASRYLTLTFNTSLGFTKNGSIIAAGISASTKTRIALTAGYDIAQVDTIDGRQTNHNFSMTAAGPLFQRMTFSTSAKYTRSDIPEFDNFSTSEDTTQIIGNIYYPFSRSTLMLEGQYMKVKRNGTLIEETKTRMLTATYYRIITKRILFNLTALWSKTEPGITYYEVKPRLSVVYRQLSLNLEYQYLKETDPFDIARHKLLVNLTRSFGLKF